MRKLILIGLTAALAGCGGEPAANNMATADDTSAVDSAIAPETGNAAAPGPAGDNAAEPTDGVIPAALHGRWGLVPADCTSTRGDAKGLLTISNMQLRFYESRATLGEIVERNADRIVADFDFVGEGQSWQRRMTLEAQDGGQTLIRRETGADALPEPLRYTKCGAA